LQRIRTLTLTLIVALILQSVTVYPVSADANGPVVVSMTPNHNAQAAVTTTVLKLTFDEPIVRGTGMIELYNATDGTLVESYNVETINSPVVQLDDSNKSIVITPTGGLTSGASYYVVVPQDAVRSHATTKPFAGIAAGSWSFRAEQLIPVAMNFVPADKYEYLDPVNPGSLSFEFARKIAKGAGFIQIKRASDHMTVRSVDINATDVTIVQAGSNWRVSFPLKGLEHNTNYYVLIDAGALVDPLNGAYAGIQSTSGAGSWTFKTKAALDTTKPKIVTYSPANNGTVADLKTTQISLVFDKTVFANQNKSLVIRNAGTGALLCTVAATSTVGSTGNTKVVIDLDKASCPKLVNNTDYSVTIGADVYRDASGNYFEGVTWKFKALADTTPPAVSAYSPAVSSTAISTSLSELSLTFNEPLGTLASSAAAQIFPQNAPNSKRDLTMSIDPANNKRLILKLSGTTKLSNSTLYSVTVPANVIRDTSGNFFGGISNPYQWTFQTGTNSVPTITNSTINGTSIVLTYSENLDSTKVPYASNFYALVNDVARPVTGISIYNNEVRLTLQGSVLIGQTVKLSYYPDSTVSKRLQNPSGIEAATFNNRVLTNATDSTLPKPESGYFYGGTLTLTFNRTLADVAPGFQSQVQSQFTVKQNGNTIGVNSAYLSGNFLSMTLNSNSTSALPVSVSYAPGAYPLRDPSGNMVPAFTDFYVRNNYDNEPPQLLSAALNGSKIVMTYNEGLNPSNVPTTTSFSIVTTGVTPPTVTKVAVVNNTVELTLSQSVSANIPVLLYYYPGSPALMDLSGNIAPAIVGYNFTSGSSDTAVLASSSISNNQLTLVYSGPLNPNSAPYSSQYTVKFDGVTIPVTGVSVAGTQVVINLSSHVQVGQTVTLSYATSGNPLRDTLDRTVAALNNITVGSQSSNGGLNQTLPDYLELDGAGTVRLILGKATSTSPSVTPSGKAAKRYQIDGNKLAGSYSSIKSNGSVSVPRVSIRIPAGEVGAIVAIPVSSVISASSTAANASFVVEYGDLQFELPLAAIDYNSELYLAGGNSSASYLQIMIEKTPSTPVLSMLGVLGAQPLATPADFTVGILTGANFRPLSNYKSYVGSTFLLEGFGNSADIISVIKLDLQSSQPTYVPTTLTNTGTAIKANFKHKGNGVFVAVRRNVMFKDMTKHWARADVSLLASKFIVTGNTATTFAPARNITRADFAEFIARGIGLEGDRSGGAKFSDVSTTSPSAAFIGAVSKAGIVEGGTDGKFRPNAAITREEMATMLIRAMNYVGVQAPASSTALNGFKDKAKVSGWAKSGMEMCVTAGIIQGSTTQTINPQSNATRAEAAIMIKRFLEYVEFL